MEEIPNIDNLSLQKQENNPIKFTKPFLKWAGGKTQIIKNIISRFPNEIKDYHEPFIGGGSVLLALLSCIKFKHIKLTGKIYAYDINPTLINLYKHIQTNHTELLQHIKHHIIEYDECISSVINRKPTTLEEGKSSKESYYYWIRKVFNELPNGNIQKSALFLIINKLCFRGLYREGPNGFNVPYGHYKKTPNIITFKELQELSVLMEDVQFECLTYLETFPKIKKYSFVYIDPPYVPINKTSFVSYNVDGFTKEKHLELFKLVQGLKDKKIKFIMSNSKAQLVEENFTSQNYKINEIECKRAINSKNPESKAMELIIWNY